MSLIDRFTKTEKRVTKALALHDEVLNLHNDVLNIKSERDEVVKSHNYKLTILSRRQSICKSTSELSDNQFLQGRLTDRLTALEHDFEKSIISKVKETYKKRERLNQLLKDREVNEIFKSEQEKHRIGDSYELVKKAYAENKINKDKFKTARKKAEKKLKNQVHYADAIVINKNNEILLLKRSIDEEDVFSGKWCLPGGHVDPNEPSKEAAVRELQEETLIELPEEVIVQHSTTLNKPTALIDYYTVYLSDSPVIMLNEREHVDYEWVSIENLENYDVIADLGTVLGELFFMNKPTEIKKGKKANIGEVRDWSGRKMKKVAPDKWEEVKESKEKEEKEIDIKKIEKSKKIEYRDFNPEKHVEIYRTIYAEDVNEIDFNSLGNHWTRDHTYEHVKNYEYGLKEQFQTKKRRAKILAVFNKGDINIGATEESNENYPKEEEIVLNKDSKPLFVSVWFDEPETGHWKYIADRYVVEGAASGGRQDLWVDKIEKSLVEKGKKANVGEIRTWADGKKYKKQGDGSWEEVSENKSDKNIKDKENNINFNYQKIKDYANKIINGENQIKRLSPEEEQGRIRGGERNVEATILLSTSTRTNSEIHDKDSQLETLRDFYFNSEHWVKDYKKHLGDKLSQATESEVFYKDGFVYKVNNFSQHEDLLEFFDRVSVQNLLFPDNGYEIIGFTDRDSQVNAIIKQPFIKMKTDDDGSVIKPSKEIISNVMGEMGFEDIGENTFINESYIIEDLHSNNVCFTSDGNISFIDPVIRINLQGEGYGGNRILGDISIDDDITKSQAAFTILQKAFESGRIDEETFEKAQKVYANNAENKRLNRVGQPWGSSGEETPSKQPKKDKEEEGKEGSKSTEEHAQEASEKALQGATKSGDEELRLAAKKELERRDGEGKEEEYKEKLDSGEYDKDEDGVRQYKDKFKDEETQKLKDIAEATKDKDLKTALGEIIKERGEGQKEESDTDHDSKIKELEEKINELRGAEIDYSDEKALQENLEQTKQAMEERKNLVSERDSLRKVSFEEYKKGFKDFVGKSTEEVSKFYEKEAEGINATEKETSDVVEYAGENHMYVRQFITDPEGYKKEYGEDELIQPMIENVSSFINKNKIKDDVVLNRRIKGDGIKFFEALEKGEVYEDKSFSSTSLMELTHFGDFNISILAKKGSLVANIDNAGEYEYLIDKGAKFRVLEKSDKNIIVELL